MMNVAQALRRRGLEYHMREDRGPTCGSLAIDMELVLFGLVEIGADARLHVTDQGLRYLSDSDGSGEADETAKQSQPEATARAEGIAQPVPPPPEVSNNDQ